MDKLFNKTPASNFAALALAGIMASGYMTYTAGKPVVMALVGGKVAGAKMMSMVQPNTQGSILGSPKVGPLTSVQKQVDSVANKVEQLAQTNQTKNDTVLGDTTESVPVREEFPPAVNLLRNSSFEEDTNLAPRQWNYQYDSNSGNSFTSAEAIRTGTKGLKFVGGGTGNYGISQPATKLIERRPYALSVWVKPVNTNAHTIKLSFWDEINNKEAASKTFSFSGTKEWSRLVFQVSNKNNWNGKKWFPMISIKGLGAGSLYIDDAQLEEASSYTPYHFVGGGSTQSHVSVLGDGSVEIDVHGNIYPAVDGVGGLGTGSNRFSELRLTKATIDNNGSLSLDGDITVNGNGTFKGAMAFDGTIKSNLIPDLDGAYDLGSTTKKWRWAYVNGVYLKNAETIGNGTDGNIDFTDSGTSNVLTMDLNVAADAVELRNDTEDLRLRSAGNGNLVLRAGDGAAESTVNGNDIFLSSEDDTIMRADTFNLTVSAADAASIALYSTTGGIDLSTGTNSGLGTANLTLRSGGTLKLDTSSNNSNLLIDSGTGDLIINVGTHTEVAQDNTVNAISLSASRGGINLSSSSASGSGDIKIKSAGTLSLDTSANNTNILANTGQGRLIATSNNAGISAIQLLTTNGGIDISTSGLNGLGELRLRSGGSLKIDTSGNNNNILIDSGTGSLLENVGVNTMVAQNDVVKAISLSASRGGIQLSSSNANGNGDIRILSAGTLQLDTSATGSNIFLRAGGGAINAQTTLNSTQAIAMLATNGGIDLSTGNAGGNGTLVLRSGGSLKLDTSSNNNNILIDSGTGDLIVNVGTHTEVAQDDAVNAISLSASRGGIQLSTSNASSNGVMYLKSAGTLVLDTSAKNSNVVVQAGTGEFNVNAGASTQTYTGTYAVTDTAQVGLTSNQNAINAIALLTTNGGIDISTSGVGGLGELRLRAGGSLKLDTSGNNNNILIDSGTGSLLENVGVNTMVAQNDVVKAISLSASRGGIQLSSSNANGNGDMRLLSAGTLQLDTSVTGSSILVRTGAGQFSVNAGQGASNAISLLATNGGIDLSTSGANGNGNLTLRSAGTLTLDTTASDTDINILAGDNTSTSLTLRSDRGGIEMSSSNAAGNGGIVIKSGGSLQLDTSLSNQNIIANTGSGSFVVTAGGTGTGANSAIRLAATNGGIDLSTSGGNGNGNMIFRSAGTLQLDTSANNSNILVRAGTGRIDLSANTILINSGTGTLTLSSEAGVTIGGQGTTTTVKGMLCIQDESTCPAQANGRLYVDTAGTAAAPDDPGDVYDLAEYYPASEPVDPGTVVIADSGARATVKMSQYAYQRVLGVVSTSPAIMINQGSFEVGAGTRQFNVAKPLVALVGRVPVKVSNENGAIKVGDRLVASTKAGYAMKATKQGMTLGMALEDMNFENGATEAKVMTFVNVSWYFPEVVNELEKEYQAAQVLGSQPNVSAALTAATSAQTDAVSNLGALSNLSDLNSTTTVGVAEPVVAPTVTVATPPTEFPNLAVTKALTVGKELKVAGKAIFEGEVEVMADATFGKNVIIVGNLRIGGNLEVAGAVVTNMTAGASIAAGDPLVVGADGKAYRAGAGKAVIGVATLSVAAGESVKVAVAGKVGNMTGLVTGSRYFVNEAGTLTTDGQGGQGLGVAVSATEMLVQPGVGLPAATEGSTFGSPKVEPLIEPVKEEVKPVETTAPAVVPTATPTPVETIVPTVIPTLVPSISPSL